MMRRCRNITYQPEGDIDIVSLRLGALWAILTAAPATDVPASVRADDQLLDWVATNGHAYPNSDRFAAVSMPWATGSAAARATCHRLITANPEDRHLWKTGPQQRTPPQTADRRATVGAARYGETTGS